MFEDDSTVMNPNYRMVVSVSLEELFDPNEPDQVKQGEALDRVIDGMVELCEFLKHVPNAVIIAGPPMEHYVGLNKENRDIFKCAKKRIYEMFKHYGLLVQSVHWFWAYLKKDPKRTRMGKSMIQVMGYAPQNPGQDTRARFAKIMELYQSLEWYTKIHCNSMIIYLLKKVGTLVNSILKQNDDYDEKLMALIPPQFHYNLAVAKKEHSMGNQTTIAQYTLTISGLLRLLHFCTM